jgi:hypothetical protein
MKGERRKLERDFREKESVKRLTTRSINANPQASAWQRIPEADNSGETKYLGFGDDINETEFTTYWVFILVYGPSTNLEFHPASSLYVSETVTLNLGEIIHSGCRNLRSQKVASCNSLLILRQSLIESLLETP